jgi:hypothetical protein
MSELLHIGLPALILCALIYIKGHWDGREAARRKRAARNGNHHTRL